MAKDPLLDQISHFQHKLEKYAKNGETDKVLYYIHKLKHLQVTVKHLEATGVGRSVNSLRHNEGLVGEKARDLVNKWKEMVSAEEEEEEEEEEEHEGNEEEEFEKRSDCDSGMDLGDQNGEEAEEDEEDDRLQIQEEDGDERSIPEYKPTSANAYRYGSESPGGGNDSSYNPLTSQIDYQLLSGSEPTGEYHPSSIGEHNNSYESSPEGDQNSGFEDASPNLSSDRRNGNTSSRGSSKKSSKADKERHKKKDKDRDKERHKDSSGSHSKEKKKDHKDKHKAKHKDKDKDREEKKEKNKSHKHKDKERHGEKPRERKNDESTEKSRTEPEKEKKKKDMINGYGTSDMEYKPQAVKHSKENNKREEEDKHRDKSGNHSHRKEERSREKENREKESSDSEYVKERDTTSREDKNKDKEKHKHRDKHGSSKKDKGKHDSKYLENQREISEDSESNNTMENKKKKSKSGTENDGDFGAALMGFDSPLKKKKKKKKKDRKEHESSDDEKPSSSKSSHKRALSEGGDLPDAKKPRLLDKPPQSLPKLPSTFSEAALESPLLPEINPNYKPLPRVPLRDDRPQVTDKMSEEETFNIMMQSKNSRRGKMYSGRVTGLQSVPTLKQCCIRVMIDYIDAIEYTGNVPYDILKPVLDRATPQQLLNIEDFNHYLLEDTDEIWEVHCRRDFRNGRRDDMESWRDLYLRCFDAREKKLKSITENLQQKFISKAKPRRQIKLAFVDTVAKVPKSVARAQAKHGTGVPSGSLVKPGKAAEIAARKTAMQNAQRAEKAAAAPRPSTAKNKKVAPLMAKTRQFYKKAFRR